MLGTTVVTIGGTIQNLGEHWKLAPRLLSLASPNKSKYADFAAVLHSCAEQLFQLINRFSQARVLVVGDLTLDEFLTGQVERLAGKHQF